MLLTGVMKSKSAKLRLVGPIIITIIVVTSFPIATIGEKNQDAVEDIVSKQSQFAATLPNGATVELLGLREYEYPSEGKKWWRPEGRIIETQKWPIVKDRSVDIGPDYSYRRIEIALRYAGPDEPKLIGWNFNGQPRVLTGSDIYCDFNSVFTFVGLVGDVNPELSRAEVSLTFGYGKFANRLTGQGETESGSYIIGKVFNGRYVWTILRQEGVAAVNVAQDFVARDMYVQAKDERGLWHVGKRVAERPGPLFQETFLFEKLPVDKVDYVVLKTRPIAKVTFKNVSLKPGEKNDVQVDINPVVKSRSRPKPKGDFRECYYVSDFLLKGGDRAEAAKRYLAVAKRYSDTDRGKMSLELAKLLEKMVEEDKQFREPKDITAQSEKERIDYYVYKLRDLVEQEFFTPGNCNILWHPRTPESAALTLREIGKPAVPALIELLEDRRPTRSVTIAMNGGVVLRYCDAALQIIEAIADKKFGDLRGTGTYLSTVDEKRRNKIVSRVRAWWVHHRNEYPRLDEWQADLSLINQKNFLGKKCSKSILYDT